MKIFITGSTGFIGKNLVQFYNNFELFEFHRNMDLEQTLNYFRPDIILNCAAEIYNAEIMLKPNLLNTIDCLEYVKKNTNTKMIQIGSSAEYGPMNRPSKESDRINPVDMYQGTKGASTLLCQGYARQYDLNVVIARPYSVYGQEEKPHRLFPRLYKAFIKNEPMELYQGYHDFIYIDDFISGIDMLINKGIKGDIVNFGSGKQHSNFEVAKMFKTIIGKDAPITIHDYMSKNYESEVWICDTEYSKITYGFQVKYTLETGIKKFLELAKY